MWGLPEGLRAGGQGCWRGQTQKSWRGRPGEASAEAAASATRGRHGAGLRAEAGRCRRLLFPRILAQRFSAQPVTRAFPSSRPPQLCTLIWGQGPGSTRVSVPRPFPLLGSGPTAACLLHPNLPPWAPSLDGKPSTAPRGLGDLTPLLPAEPRPCVCISVCVSRLACVWRVWRV